MEVAQRPEYPEISGHTTLDGSVSSEVIVLCWKTPTSSERNARKIAEFMGAQATFVSVAVAVSSGETSLSTLTASCACLIVNVETLAQAADAMATDASALQPLIGSAKHVLVYGFQPTDRHDRILRALSGHRLLGIQRPAGPAAQFYVTDGHREWCKEFSGLSFGATDPKRDAVFLEATGDQRQAALIRAGDKPFFVRVHHGASNLFLLSCGELADLEEEVSYQAGLLPWFSRLVPSMMFLRGALGTRVWHNDHPRACFIIDDPLLKARYGFLEYRRLLHTMRGQRFSTSIAFIPWNYRRSVQEIADLFGTSVGAPSLCVHGCDHTQAEFGTSDFGVLCSKAWLALVRMRAHRRWSGALFDNVMVFPQGIFSSEALQALDACGYLAAVNTDLAPSSTRATLPLRDLLEVAITRFGDFPLFGRRYAKEPAELAFDLFLGKPALIVEHHGYFRGNGYDALQAFVRTLNAIESHLEWTNLTMICSRASLQRVAAADEIHVRFYTNRFRLTNDGNHLRRYVLFRRRPRRPSPLRVQINHRPWDCEQVDDDLKITLSLDVGQTADVRVVYDGPHRVTTSRRQTTVYNAGVLARRLLCEFRDNHLDTNRLLTGRARGARTLRPRALLRGV